MSQGCPNCVLRWCLHSDILLTSPERQFQHNTEHIIVVLFLILLTKCVAGNAGKLVAIYFYSFEETSSSKRTKKTCVGWRTLDVPRTSILKLLYKCIFITLFSIPFFKMCAWSNEGLAVLQFYIFGETSQRRLINVSKWRPKDDALGTFPGHQFWT